MTTLNDPLLLRQSIDAAHTLLDQTGITPRARSHKALVERIRDALDARELAAWRYLPEIPDDEITVICAHTDGRGTREVHEGYKIGGDWYYTHGAEDPPVKMKNVYAWRHVPEPPPRRKFDLPLYAVSASTTDPNTAESDAQRRVLHTVHLSDGSTRYVVATDPSDAIARVDRKLRKP